MATEIVGNKINQTYQKLSSVLYREFQKISVLPHGRD